MRSRNGHILTSVWAALPLLVVLSARSGISGRTRSFFSGPPPAVEATDPGSLSVARFPVAPDTLLWPARTEPGLTSSFGEYREGHIHAGIDVKTWGRVGVPLVAVADGSIRRVRTSPWGYGKALYLELASGETAVYGHMDRFTSEIEEEIHRNQQEEGRYTVDLWFPAGRRPVRGGEVVGYSGETGTDAPHLHFELRDPQNRPLNPLNHGIVVKDTIPPVIQAIVLRPIGGLARLDGGVLARDFIAQSRGRGRYSLRERPQVEGAVAVGLVGYDLMDGVWNRYSPYRMVLEVDGRTVFETRYDFFDLAVTADIHLDRDYRHMVRTGTRAHTLWHQSGNRLPFYGAYGEGAGILDGLAPGAHHLVVSAVDAAGNRSTLEAEIVLNRPPRIEVKVPEPVDRAQDVLDLTAGDPNDPYPNGLEATVSDLDGDPVTVSVEEWTADGWRRRVEGLQPDGQGRLRIEANVLQATSPDPSGAFRLRATDRWGRSTTTLPWPLGPVRSVESGPGTAPGAGQVSMASPGPVPGNETDALRIGLERYEGFLLLAARSHDPIPGRVTFSVQVSESDVRVLEGIPDGEGTYRAVFPLEPTEARRLEITARFLPLRGRMRQVETHFEAMPVAADRPAELSSEDGRFQLTIPAGTFLADDFVELRAGPPLVRPVEGLVLLSPIYVTGPEDVLFRGQARIRLQTDARPPGVRPAQVGLYTAWQEEGVWGWVYLGGALEGGALRADIGGFGTFAALADTAAPTIRLLSPGDGSVVRNGRPRIVFEIIDAASGFDDERQFVLRIDGRPVVPRYDPPRDQLIYTPWEPLVPGNHTIELEVTDGASNTARLQARFTVR
jgi:hypothetical protein